MRGRKGLAALLAALVLLSTATAGVAALNFTDGEAPNPMIEADTTVDAYQVEWGDDLQYEDDSGAVTDLAATLNRSSDTDELGNGHVNPFTFTVTDVEFDDSGEFPRKSDESDNSASALDASEWSTSGATMSDVTTAPSVEAVEYAGTDSSNSSTYDNFSVTSDVQKRYVQIAADLSSASGTPTMEVHDSDGDYVVVELYNSSADTSANDVLANSTGEGKMLQTQIGKLSVQGSGDGEMGEIQKIVINGDVNADFSVINLEKTSKYDLGEKYVENDDDDELETETIHETTGPVSVHSVETMGDSFSGATIHGLTFPAHFSASDLADSDRQANFSQDNAYPNWDVIADIYYRISLPSAYDLSYSNVELVQTTNWAETRYATVELKEDAGDTEFSEIDSWTDVTSSFSSEGKDVTLDSTVSVGTEYALHYELKLTGDEASAMQASMGGGAAPMVGGSGPLGGILSFVFSLPGMVLTGIGAFVGGRRLGVF